MNLTKLLSDTVFHLFTALLAAVWLTIMLLYLYPNQVPVMLRQEETFRLHYFMLADDTPTIVLQQKTSDLLTRTDDRQRPMISLRMKSGSCIQEKNHRAVRYMNFHFDPPCRPRGFGFHEIEAHIVRLQLSDGLHNKTADASMFQPLNRHSVLRTPLRRPTHFYGWLSLAALPVWPVLWAVWAWQRKKKQAV